MHPDVTGKEGDKCSKMRAWKLESCKKLLIARQRIIELIRCDELKKIEITTSSAINVCCILHR